MFLIYLNNDEKKSFLKLAQYVARIDKNYSREEEQIIKHYCQEMQLSYPESFDIKEFNLKSVLDVFKTKKAQRIVMMEIIGLIYADEQIVKEEERLIEEMGKNFGISFNVLAVYTHWAKAMSSLFKQGIALQEI